METASLIERLFLERRRLLLVNLVSYALWCGTLVLLLSSIVPASMRGPLGAASTAFGLSWGIALCGFIYWARKLRRHPPAVAAALNDELMVRNRWQAQRASLVTLLVCLVACFELSEFIHLNVRPVLMALIWIQVVSQFGFLLWYERD